MEATASHACAASTKRRHRSEAQKRKRNSRHQHNAASRKRKEMRLLRNCVGVPQPLPAPPSSPLPPAIAALLCDGYVIVKKGRLTDFVPPSRLHKVVRVKRREQPVLKADSLSPAVVLHFIHRDKVRCQETPKSSHPSAKESIADRKRRLDRVVLDLSRLFEE